MRTRRTTFQCRDFSHWSEEPHGFHELKHWVVCPIHNEPMYMVRGSYPEEIGLGERHRVDGILRRMDVTP